MCKFKPLCIKYTDHQSVFFKSVIEEGKGFWKINNSISNDKYCRDMINDLIVKYSAKINKDMKKTCKLLWDAHKVEIREVTMTFSKLKAKESRELTRTLEKTLEDKLTYSDTAVIDNAILNNEIYKLEKEIEQIYEQKAKDVQIRSRKKWVEYGENTMLIF